MHGVTEVADVDDPDCNADKGDDLGKLLAEFIQLLLQRGLLGLRGHHLIPDFPNLCVHSGGNDNTNSFACSNVRSLRKRKEILDEVLSHRPTFSLHTFWQTRATCGLTAPFEGFTQK